MENIENKPKRKVTRKIKKFDFSDESATVSLVGESVGGGANGWQTLITKSKKNVSEEFLKKASQVTITLEIAEYLRRFFGLWYEDAEILARSLGFTTAEMEHEAMEEKMGDMEMSYKDYIQEKVASIKVMKSLFDSENIEKAVLDLSEEDYLKILQDQEIVEKAFVEIDKACKGKGIKPVKKNSSANAGDASTNVDVENSEGNTSVIKNNKGSKPMTQEVQTIEQQVEVIAKAKFDEIQKSLSDTQVELQKALDLVKKFETEKKEAIAKARKEQLNKACGKHSEVIFKACGEIEEELFVEVVKALADMQETIEKSALFQEQGASVDGQDSSESPIAKALKARLAKNQ